MSVINYKNITLDTGIISYRQAGRGQDLVFLHGLAGNSRTWENQMKFFSKRFRVTSWDAPGYGNSTQVKPDVETYAKVLSNFTTAIGIEKFILLGHSMGGIVAGNFASQFPYRLFGLVLSCTFLGRNQPKGSRLNKNYRLRLAQLDSMNPIDYGRIRMETMVASDCDPKIIEYFARIAAETPKGGLMNAMRLISEANNEPYFSQLNMPILVLAGDQDTTVTKETTKIMIDSIPKNIPSLSITYLKGVGHAPYMENAHKYNRVLDSFFDSLKHWPNKKLF